LFAGLECRPRWRERLAELAIPTLVVHGRRDPFFPEGNGEALARQIPDARLLFGSTFTAQTAAQSSFLADLNGSRACGLTCSDAHHRGHRALHVTGVRAQDTTLAPALRGGLVDPNLDAGRRNLERDHERVSDTRDQLALGFETAGALLNSDDGHRRLLGLT
jgi:hypothetical protein